MIESSTLPPPILVGDHLALDFLNSTAAPASESVEWLGDGAELLDWLAAAGAIEKAVAERFRAKPGAGRELDAVAAEARRLREWLRGFVGAHARKRVGAAALAELAPVNRLLARDDAYRQIAAAPKGRTLELRDERRWTHPERLLQPIAQAIGDLLANADFRYVRCCEGVGCTLYFYDRSKAHGRRWCSMAVCGNRAKAAAHRARQRREAAHGEGRA